MSVIVIQPCELKEILKEVIDSALSSKLHNLSPVQDQGSSLLTIEEAADLLNVSLSTIHAYKRKKLILPLAGFGRRVYFDRNEIISKMKGGIK